MKANKNKNQKIFRLSNGTIQIYNFEPIQSRISLFRLREMKKIGEDERILTRENNPTWFTPKKGIVYECGGYILRKSPPKSFEEKENNYFFVRRYIEGLFKNGSVHVLERDDQEGQKLFILNPKDEDETNKKIQLTPDLYLEYLLENERFSSHALQEQDLAREQSLFDISSQPIMECSLESLQDLLDSGLVKGNYDEKVELLEGSTKVYEKLRQAK